MPYGNQARAVLQITVMSPATSSLRQACKKFYITVLLHGGGVHGMIISTPRGMD
jgi:hypothetical protein